jgi:hypothetical protein
VLWLDACRGPLWIWAAVWIAFSSLLWRSTHRDRAAVHQRLLPAGPHEHRGAAARCGFANRGCSDDGSRRSSHGNATGFDAPSVFFDTLLEAAPDEIEACQHDSATSS